MPKKNPPVEAQDGQPEATLATEPQQPKTTTYAVYEATTVRGDIAATLQLVDVVDTEDAAGARWAAVDSDPTLEVAARADAEGEPPMLLALAARFAKPVATREEQIVQTKRR